MARSVILIEVGRERDLPEHKIRVRAISVTPAGLIQLEIVDRQPSAPPKIGGKKPRKPKPLTPRRERR